MGKVTIARIDCRQYNSNKVFRDPTEEHIHGQYNIKKPVWKNADSLIQYTLYVRKQLSFSLLILKHGKYADFPKQGFSNKSFFRMLIFIYCFLVGYRGKHENALSVQTFILRFKEESMSLSCTGASQQLSNSCRGTILYWNRHTTVLTRQLEII
jgi:hypothetical protein